MAPVTLWRELEIATRAACKRFGLRPVRLVASTDPRATFLGKCAYAEDDAEAVITLRVHRLKRPRQPLSRRAILDTLAHELGHVSAHGHGPEWRAQYVAIRDYLRGAVKL